MMMTRTFFSRAPLAPGRYAPLPAGAVAVQGASRERLLALRAGLLSRCASLFPEAGAQSDFFGGTLCGGLRAPDLLEAMLLTGAQLGDEELRREALSLALRVTDAQREDGSFAPEESFAARGRMLRALTWAYTMSGEKRVLTFMLRYMKFLQETLAERPLSPEDAMHIADTLECGVFLYNVTGQRAILSVLAMLIRQGADYTTLMHAFPYRTPISRTLSAEALLAALEQEDETGYHHHLMRTANGANLAEGLRACALSGVITGSGKQLSAAEAGLARIGKAHGSVAGAFTADPLLAGTSPSRGVSALTACEMAASLEALFSCPGGEHGADELETVMYNAVDAAFAPDGRGVQAVQQANQTLLSRELRFPFMPDSSNLFTCEDGDALCALLAAWPRFYQHQWMLTRDDGLCAMGYAPCTVRYRLGGASVRITVESRYPQDGSVRITVNTSAPVAFPLSLRIPMWAKGATAAIGGEILPAAQGDVLTLNREWSDGDVVLLTLPMQPARIPCYHQAACVARGPLRFAYAPQTQGGTSEEGYALLSASEQFGLALVGEASLEAEESEDGVVIVTRAISLPDWGMRGPSCDQPPLVLPRDAQGEPFPVRLVPYARAVIRLCALPVV